MIVFPRVMHLYLSRPLPLSPSFSFSAVPPFGKCSLSQQPCTSSLLLPVDGLPIDVVVKGEIDTDWMLCVQQGDIRVVVDDSSHLETTAVFAH